MTGRVFTKLLFSFLLVLCIGTAILDFSVRRIVRHSLYAQAEAYYGSEARLMAGQLAHSSAAQLPEVLEAQALAARAEIVLRDRTGQIIAHAPGTSSLLAGAPSGLGQDSRVLRSPELPSPDGRFGDLLAITVPAGAYTAHFVFELTGARSTLGLMRRDLLLASMVALVVATLLAAFLAQRVARRMGRIVRFAHRVAAGDLSARIEEGRLDEVSEVAHALDATAARLEASFRALDGSRRELAVLLDSMQEAVIGISPQSQVTWSNSKMRAISPGVVREGRSLVECIRDPEVLRCVGIAMREGALGRGRATSFLPGRAFAVSAAPMPGGGAVAVLHDVTDAERAERTRRDFVANVSHELRTPLTSITGYVETVLEEDALSGEGREFLGIVLRNATRMNRLTADLLALATVEAGDYRLKPRSVPADMLIDDAVNSLAGMAVDSGIRLERAAAPRTPVLADLDAIHQVFVNLIENAMKYGHSGGRVRVGARELGDHIEFSVQDFGPGIASEHLERIFERFYRVDKARSRDSGGTGLGLAIVKHIILAHGGTIRTESELGGGATFLFTLKRSPEAAAVERGAEAAALSAHS